MAGEDEQRQKSLIEYLLWATAVLSAFNCIIRPDYNIIFSLLFLYVVISQNLDNVGYKNLCYMTVFLLIVDLLWVITLGWIWSEDPPTYNQNWESFRSMHHIVIFLSIVEIIFKAGLVYFLFQLSADDDARQKLDDFKSSMKQRLNRRA
mmetsp:Transcript_49136/g.56490  ORF Transcript_49136/g.56490 Transcript_49136/m.56490 type:complete len:149 (-) Transcript_49136:375-821(-)